LSTKKIKLLRVTTVPISLKLLIPGQMRFMRENGIEVVAVCAQGPEIENIVFSEGVKLELIPLTRTISPLRDLYALYLMIKLILLEKPDIIHTHTPKAGLIGMLAGYICRVPKRMHTVAGMPLMSHTGTTRFLLLTVEWLTYQCAHLILPNSIALRDYIFDHIYVNPKKVLVIGNGSSNGIDTDFFKKSEDLEKKGEELKSQLKIPDSAFIWLFIGRLVGDKGIHELIDSFVNLQKTNDRHFLILVGAFEDEKDAINRQTKDQIAEHKHIFSVGFQEDVRPWLQISDVFVFPSYREGFPNVVLQAQSMELPCIVSDINGCNEIVIDGYNGIIIPPRNAIALEEAMAQYADDFGLFQLNKSKTRKSVLKKYNRVELWNQLLKEYKS
jgi:glycosyltransferase involved in cell wall biosynthesis